MQLSDAQAIDDLIISLIRGSPAKETDRAPSRGDDQLQSTEILTSEPILPQPLNCEDLPFTWLVYPGGVAGPASQETPTEHPPPNDAGPKDGDEGSLAVKESASISPTQKPQLLADKVKLVQEHMAQCQKSFQENVAERLLKELVVKLVEDKKALEQRYMSLQENNKASVKKHKGMLLSSLGFVC